MSEATCIAIGGITCAVISALICYLLVPRIVCRVLSDLLNSPKENPMNRTKTERGAYTTSVATLIIIALSITMIVMAVQMYRTQHALTQANDDRDSAIECSLIYANQIEEWANGGEDKTGMIEALRDSRDANQQVRDADREWHKAVDGVFQLIVQSQSQPEGTEIPDEIVDKVLADYVEAQKRLAEAYSNATTVQNTNPYPQLDLQCTTGG